MPDVSVKAGTRLEQDSALLFTPSKTAPVLLQLKDAIPRLRL